MSRTKFWRLCTSLALSFVLVQSTLAAPPQIQASSPPAATLLQKSLAALVGNASISDVTLTGTARRIAGPDDESGTVTVKALADGSGKIQLSLPSGDRNEVRSAGTSGPVGAWSGPDGVSHTISNYNLMTDFGWFPTFTISNILSSNTSVVVNLGQETKESRSVLHLSVSKQYPEIADDTTLLQHLSTIEIFLDASTYLPAALSYNIHANNNGFVDIPVEIHFSDYRSVSGSQIPFHIQKFINNTVCLDVQFTAITLNSRLPAMEFAIQ